MRNHLLTGLNLDKKIFFRKSPDVIVISEDISKYELINSRNGKHLSLDETHTIYWQELNESNSGGFSFSFLKQLLENGFIEKISKIKRIIPEDKSDLIVPKIAGNHVRHHLESIDLTVLYNTANLTSNNPLLVLGTYGTQIWNGVLACQTIFEIRQNISKLFGEDEVLLFLTRLIDLGFIENIPSILNLQDSKENVRKEFLAPYVQSLLPRAAKPWYCLWEICSACNLRCQNCYLPDFSKDCQPDSTVLGIAEHIVKQGIFYVTILGGEPLLVRNLEKVIKKMRDEGVFVKVISNGKHFTRTRAELLAKSNLNQFEVSFDGLTEQSHDRSRGNTSFSSAIKTVTIAQNAGISRVGIVLTICNENFHELKSLPTFMDRLGVQECYISLFRKIGLNGEKYPISPIKKNHFILLEEKISEFSSNYPHLTISVLSNCTCGKTSVVIGEEGDVRPCPFKQTVVGNVFDEPFQEIWSDLQNRIPNDIDFGSPEYCKLPISNE